MLTSTRHRPCQALEAELRGRIAAAAGSKELAESKFEPPRTAAWFAAYKAAGIKGGKAKVFPGVHGLLQRIKKGQGDKIPFVSALVAITNMVALEYTCPTGAFDLVRRPASAAATAPYGHGGRSPRAAECCTLALPLRGPGRPRSRGRSSWGRLMARKSSPESTRARKPSPLAQVRTLAAALTLILPPHSGCRVWHRSQCCPLGKGDVVLKDDTQKVVICNNWNSKGGKDTAISGAVKDVVIDIDMIIDPAHLAIDETVILLHPRLP